MFNNFSGNARTQSPTNKNYALDSPPFGVIAGFTPTEVQWKGLDLEIRPSGSPNSPCERTYHSLQHESLMLLSHCDNQ